MDLDLNKFRTLIPIHSLYEESLLYLVENTRLERHQQGDGLFSIGDQDNDTLFVMSGEILLDDGNTQQTISSGTDQALYALSNQKPRQHRGVVLSETAVIAHIDARLLGRLLSWGEFAETQVIQELVEREQAINTGPGIGKSAWMMAMLQTSTFLQLPAANIQSLFARMEEIHVKAGDVIVNMGEAGEYYYVVAQGRCRVTRPLVSGNEILAELESCSSFGEESLISDTPRNATVTMLTDGVLMRLSKADFVELMEAPLQKRVDQQTATDMIRAGAIRIDVRMEDEFANCRVEGALNIPLHQLRSRSDQLDRSLEYIFCCDTGQRSSAAAFLMSQLGFDAYLLDGGFTALLK